LGRDPARLSADPATHGYAGASREVCQTSLAVIMQDLESSAGQAGIKLTLSAQWRTACISFTRASTGNGR
jgi:hypothetical protein